MVRRGYELFRNSRPASRTPSRIGSRVSCRTSWFVFSETGVRLQGSPVSQSPLIAHLNKDSAQRLELASAGMSALLPECRLFRRNPNISIELIERELFGNRRHSAECALPRRTVQNFEASQGEQPWNGGGNWTNTIH